MASTTLGSAMLGAVVGLVAGVIFFVLTEG